MTQRFVPLPEQVRELQIKQTQQGRQLRIVEADARRSAQQAEAAIEDVRTLSDLARRLERRLDQTDEAVARVNANVLVIAGQQGEQLVVMARMADVLEEIRPSVESARRKASGAHHRAVALEARVSAAEDRDREFEAKMAIAQADGAALAKQRSEKLSTKGALGTGGIAAVIPAIIAAMQGQALTYAVGIGIGLGVVIVGTFYLLRHLRKAKS